MNNQFYVYQWLRTDGTPYYIGKGQTNRAFDKRRRYIPPTRSRIEIIKDNLTEDQAFELEIKLIAEYGRKEFGGILRNKTEGGEGPSLTQSTKDKLSKMFKGKKKNYTVWNKGKTGLQVSHRKGGNRSDLSPEARKRIGDKVRAFRLGKKHSVESKEKMSKATLGKKRPDMIGNKLSSGERDNSHFRTDAWRQKMRDVALRRWANA
jgi:hypothetical protein|tara:strand:- start:44 stop:661 length:618 start_codon:yes stop_codon:yes gene_type:complete